MIAIIALYIVRALLVSAIQIDRLTAPMAVVPARSALAASLRRAFVRAGAVTIFVVALDQFTKHLVIRSIGPEQVVKVLPGIKLVHWSNPGVAFSFLSGGGAPVYVLGAIALPC